jgi:hypothetical protein
LEFSGYRMENVWIRINKKNLNDDEPLYFLKYKSPKNDRIIGQSILSENFYNLLDVWELDSNEFFEDKKLKENLKLMKL